jgi:DNA-binding NarL/FixJ family response regulator
MTNLKERIPTWAALTRVLICDERSSARTALMRVVGASMPTVTDIGGATDGHDLFAQYSAEPAGLVLIGIKRGKVDGIEAAQRLLDAYPSAAIIVYGASEDAPLLISAIARGARGLLLWDANYPSSSGRQRTLTFGGTASTRESDNVTARLTERELQILRGMSQGNSNGEIGRKLYLSEDTVKTHARRLFQKLGAHDRAHAVALGLRNDLVA